MARSRQVEQKSRVRQALRATRRTFRSLDSSGEQFERRIDRLIDRKTIVYADELEPLIGQYRDMQTRMKSLEGALTDLVTIAGY